MISSKFNLYNDDWHQFKDSCEKKTKDRCKLNSNCWKKLKEWHLEQFCNKIDKPFGFLFEFRYMHKRVFIKTPGSYNLYYKYLREHQEGFDGIK